MGLITKEVEVKLNSMNISYYENLGYEIPRYYNKGNYKYMVKRGTTILVKVDDLQPSSTTLVDVTCDNCDKEPYKITYQKYRIRNHNGKIYCHNCANAVLNSGENNSNWKPELTDEEREWFRATPEYINFVKNVFERDDYTCKCCNKKINGDGEAHHLDGYNWYKEGRHDVTNGITLCHNCHNNFHAIYGRGNNTREQFEEWIGKSVKALEYKGELSPTRKIFSYEENKVYNSAIEYVTSKTNKSKSFSNVYNICNKKENSGTLYGNHLFYLDEYENMSNDEIIKRITPKPRPSKMVVCITTGEIFYKVIDATKKYNAKSITDCCRHKYGAKHSGKLLDGTPLEWIYYEDFLQLPIEEQNIILARNQESLNDDSFIMQ